jgi:hypothetical protein
MPPISQTEIFFKKKGGIDAVNLSNIVQSCIPEFVKSKSTPCISYKYIPTIASKLFNYEQILQCLDIEHLLLNPPRCSCSSSPFNYQPAGHVITGDVSIVRNEELMSLSLKDPKFRGLRSFKMAKSKKELDSLSEWVKRMRHFKIPH